MHKRPIRKAIALIFVYSVFIIGIFFLQFRSDSVISKNLGAMRVSIDRSVNPSGEATLKNRFTVTFKGISILADETMPVVLKTNNKETSLVLESFEENENGITLRFDNDVALSFSTSSDNEESSEDKTGLAVVANIPENSTLHLGYKPVSGFSATENGSDKMEFSSKGKTFILNVSSLENNEMILTSTKNLATFVPVFATERFYLASIENGNTIYALSDKALYDKTILQTKNALINKVQEDLAKSTIFSESAAVTYIAEMASRGVLKNALENIPDSIKKSQRRSYFSSTFFNSLVAMEPSLRRQHENLSSIVNTSMAENTLDVFNATNISNYILVNSKSKSIEKLLKMPGNMKPFNPTIEQATSILSVYSDLKEKSNSQADYLVPVLEKCVEKIESCCVIEDEKLLLVDNGVPMSLVQSVITGATILDYAEIARKPELMAGARMIVNSVLVDAIPSDLHDLTEIYSAISRNNTFYPHVEILYERENGTIWAWTSAQSIKYEMNETENSATIKIKFPMGESHYLMIKGIEPFNGIDIYGIAYRMDSRFETYNSSGYAYNEKIKTLFLKSKHKTDVEEIKLYFGQKPQREETTLKFAPTQKPEPTVSKATTSSEASSKPTENYSTSNEN